MSGIDGTRTRNVPNLNSGVSNSRSFTKCSGVMDFRHSEAERYVEESVAHSCSEPGLNTMRSRSTAAFEFNPSLDRVTANSRIVGTIPGNESVAHTSARIQPCLKDLKNLKVRFLGFVGFFIFKSEFLLFHVKLCKF